MSIGEMMNKDGQQPGAEGFNTSAAGGEHQAHDGSDAKVVDAEFEEVKEDDKK